MTYHLFLPGMRGGITLSGPPMLVGLSYDLTKTKNLIVQFLAVLFLYLRYTYFEQLRVTGVLPHCHYAN